MTGPTRPRLTIEDLVRWRDHGATWRVLDVSETRAVVELCSCSGEAVDTLESDVPEVIAFVREHRGD